ncbi:MAG: DNA recombination protein RmuC [Pseudomonadales bacterium]|nr:DNA recombination protein RmuC [Pseudomonadales bacterium]
MSKKTTGLKNTSLSIKAELEKTTLSCQTLQSQLVDITSVRHSAEKSLYALEAELQEKKNHQQDLINRLAITTDELKAERENLNQQRSISAQLDKEARGHEVKAYETELKYQEIKEPLNQLKNKFEDLQGQFSSLSSEHTELNTSLKEREKNHQQQLEQFAEQKLVLKKEFENLANKIFEEKGRSFTDTSKISINAMLKPFREQIDGFQNRINAIHDESLKGNTHLNSEIKKVLEIGLKMSDDASNLTSALKGSSQQRGAWGEAQLKRTLEMSGLIEDAHYETQSSFKDVDGKQKQTDYLIKLPDNKHIIIDSKVSLIAYEKAVSLDSLEEQVLAMKEHVKAVKKHIDDLASKDYTNLVGMRSPSFVLMFMPIEPAYIDALRSNKDLFSYGYERGIVLVSHTTLIPILRTVANLWMMERSNEEAREISDKAGEIYNQVCIVAERLQKLGGTLGTVSNHYNATVKALVGQQGLHGKVDRFNQLSSKVSKTMPALNAAHIDFETEQLSLIAEAIVDETPDEKASELFGMADETNTPDHGIK